METSAYHENIIGTGLSLKSSYSGTLNYYGLRSGLGKLSTRYNLSSRSTTLSFWALVVGGEHLFSHHFSLGGEAQLRFEEGKNNHSWRNTNYTTEEIKLSVILRFMI